MRILVHNISVLLQTKKLDMPKISQNCTYLTFLFVGVQKCYAPKFTSTNSKKLTENVFEIIICIDCLKFEIKEKKSQSLEFRLSLKETLQKISSCNFLNLNGSEMPLKNFNDNSAPLR